MITKRPERLTGVDYTGFQRYFLTICTAFRRPMFVWPGVVEPILLRFQEIAGSRDFSIPAHCFMPDHLHALITATAEQANFREFVRIFKQITAFEHRRQYAESLWQPGYHERILRDDESTHAVVRYIWENPVRAGLTKQLGEYPYCGSDTYELSDIIDLWHGRT